ncbi:hypothetical protein [Mycolicibacter sinensis]|uniref:Uncharacterized protein n=1 Tax=Mycolicibacter sinensis (strain JDM601) TaxID=875328 RepID=A0A1A3TUN4_MYCSD|nr:hypothetical protein [Mycolicibacter sinensis]OBK86351.1 hypothetical protein A5648_05890 [Mycolicibacter sinensis]
MSTAAERLLARAEALLDAPDGAAVGNSARLAAFLARQAVEELIDARCAMLCDFPVVVGTAKARLAVLKSLDFTPAGEVLIDSWHQLTGFCHQHAYQLAPTVQEVRVLCAAVQEASSHMGSLPKEKLG